MPVLSHDDLGWLNWEPALSGPGVASGGAAGESRKSLSLRSLARSLVRQRCPQTKHPEERLIHSSWLLGRDATLLNRPHRGTSWISYGSALRLLKGNPANAAPYLVNHSWDCLERSGAFPECCGLGMGLPAGRCSRVVFEVCHADATKRVKFAQVGVARVGADEADELDGVADESKLSVFTPLLGSMCFTSCGEIQATMPIEVTSPGGQLLCRRADDWWSGAPQWDLGTGSVRVFLEVDLAHGGVSFRLASWEEEPILLQVPGLESSSSRPWAPMVCLSHGQEARILDLHVVSS